MDLSLGLLECPHDMAAGLPQDEWSGTRWPSLVSHQHDLRHKPCFSILSLSYLLKQPAPSPQDCRSFGCWGPSRAGSLSEAALPSGSGAQISSLNHVLFKCVLNIQVFGIFQLSFCSFFFFFLKFIYFIFGCVGSLLCSGFSLVVASEGYSLLRCAGLSLRWLLLLWSTGSRRADFSSCGSWALERRLGNCGAPA